MTSNFFELHAPAGEGPSAGLQPFRTPVSAELAEWLQNAVAEGFLPGFRLVRCHAREPSTECNLCLRAEGRVGEQFRTLFVRILPPGNEEKRRQTEAILDYLRGRGLPVVTGLPSRADPSACAVIKEAWIPGIKVRITVGEFHDFESIPADGPFLRSAGAALGRLHTALEELPLRETVRQNRERFVARMEASLDRLRRAVRSGDYSVLGRYGSWGARNAPFLARLAAKYRPDFRLWPDSESQPLHGDVHGGNLLRCGKEYWFLDFEDAVHSHFPRWTDAAMAIQRLVMKGEGNPQRVGVGLRAFLQGYEAAAPPVFSSGDSSRGNQLSEMMSQLAYRSVCVLTAAWTESGADFGLPEWDKFAGLERQAREYASVFREALDGKP